MGVLEESRTHLQQFVTVQKQKGNEVELRKLRAEVKAVKRSREGCMHWFFGSVYPCMRCAPVSRATVALLLQRIRKLGLLVCIACRCSVILDTVPRTDAQSQLQQQHHARSQLTQHFCKGWSHSRKADSHLISTPPI